jgi:hypothetical protein
MVAQWRKPRTDSEHWDYDMEDEVNLQKKNRQHLWKPGQSGNPAGRPVGARQKIEGAFLESLRKKWESEGDDIIDRVARDNPEKIVEVMARVLPKELAISVEQKTPGNLSPDAYAALRRLLDIIQAAQVEGDPQAIFERIESALRADSAVLIERTHDN